MKRVEPDAPHREHVASVAEKPGMSGNSSENEAVVVVYFAAQHVAAPGAMFGGGDVRRGWQKLEAIERRETQDPLLKKGVEGQSDGRFKGPSQEQKTKVRIHRLAFERPWHMRANDFFLIKRSGFAGRASWIKTPPAVDVVKTRVKG